MVKRKNLNKRGVKPRRARSQMTRLVHQMPSAEQKLLNLITDPCGAELTHGYALTTEGVVQRFNRFITPVATTETAFAYLFNPNSQTTGSIYQKLATGTGVPTTISASGPGEAFIEANADYVAPLAACIEVLYTGKLVDRKGYIGVCQVNGIVANDIQASTTDLPTLLTYCQHVAPVPSHSVELKWSPSLRNFTAQNGNSESLSPFPDNWLMVVAVGVNPTDFVVKFTSVYEYAPKFALGLPAPRATRSIPIGAGERIVSTLDRMGVWWHNLGNAAAAAYRLGGAMSYGVNQAARTVTAYGGAARAALEMGRAAVPLLALAG